MRIRNMTERMTSWSSRPTACVAVLGICILLGGSRGVAVGAGCTHVAQCDLETGEWAEVYKINSGKAAKPGGMIKTDAQGKNRGIDNSRYAWFLEADFNRGGQDMYLFSVRIEYM